MLGASLLEAEWSEVGELRNIGGCSEPLSSGRKMHREAPHLYSASHISLQDAPRMMHNPYKAFLSMSASSRSFMAVSEGSALMLGSESKES